MLDQGFDLYQNCPAQNPRKSVLVQLDGMVLKSTKPTSSEFKFDLCLFDQFESFLEQHHEQLFPGTKYHSNPQRSAYYLGNSECGLMTADSRPIGGLCCQLVGWDTFYIRHVSMLPGFQNFGLWNGLLDAILSKISHPIKYIDIETKPDNHRHIHILNKKSFQVYSLSQTDHWGTLLKFRNSI